MAAQSIRDDLERFGMKLERVTVPSYLHYKWATYPAGSRWPFQYFTDMQSVENYWRNTWQDLLQDVEAGRALSGYLHTLSDSQIMTIASWVAGETPNTPKCLYPALKHGRSLPYQRRWRSRIDHCASQFGLAKTSWIHEAVAEAISPRIRSRL